ncbi:MAG: hypothetical protein DDT37_01625 [Firmicutes bacterium]|nr:hypothetical protein [candidate division NPL-UPA2 bacterium]
MIQQEYARLESLRLPTLGPVASMQAARGMQPALAGAGATLGTGMTTYHGPLIHIQTMTVRSDADIENISRQLYRHIQTQTRAQGGR